LKTLKRTALVCLSSAFLAACGNSTPSPRIEAGAASEERSFTLAHDYADSADVTIAVNPAKTEVGEFVRTPDSPGLTYKNAAGLYGQMMTGGNYYYESFGAGNSLRYETPLFLSERQKAERMRLRNVYDTVASHLPANSTAKCEKPAGKPVLTCKILGG
jgi:hypothetical protein